LTVWMMLLRHGGERKKNTMSLCWKNISENNIVFLVLIWCLFVCKSMLTGDII
jgi:hypothetical protein